MIKRLSSSIRFRFRHNLRRVRNIIERTRNKVFWGEQSEKYGRFSMDLTSLTGPIRGKRVLEIGNDKEGVLLNFLAKLGAIEVTGINPSLRESTRNGMAHLIKGDARSLPLSDSSVDLVVSISVLEHVRNLDEVIEEAHRVLCSGGCFYAEFGPIWSATWGHHLWLYYGGQVVNWRTHPLPPYAHLLMKPLELREWCTARFGDANLASQITEFVFQSPEQNRLFYSDYEALATNSKFETLLLTGCTDIPTGQMSGDLPISEYLTLLRQRYPDKTGFGYHVGRLLLRKR